MAADLRLRPLTVKPPAVGRTGSKNRPPLPADGYRFARLKTIWTAVPPPSLAFH